MKFNKWTLGLAAVGVVSLASVAQAEEKMGSSVMTALSSTVLSGYVDTSMQWNLGTGNAFAPAFKFNGPKKADGFNLNVVKVTLEKPLDEAEWSAGYKTDLLFGPDANAFPGGLGTSSTGVSSDFAIKQAYVALRAPVGNGLDVKVGVFDSIIGYESTEAGNNPNFTRSWGHTIEPSTHTGVLASYRINNMIQLAAGVANTMSATINSRAFTPTGVGGKAESYKTYMGSIALTAPENWGFVSGSSLYGGVVNGFNNVVGTGADQTSFYAGLTLATPVTGLRVGASYDYAGISKQPLTGNNSAYANAVALYTSFQATEKLSLHVRGEYASLSKNLTSLAQGANFFGTPGAIGGVPGEVLALTGTIQYDLWKNVISRLEVRWDHSLDGGKAFGNVGPGTTTGDGVFYGGSRKNSYIVAANLIYKF
ncbi:MAG: hypothetical protein JWQ71_2991 [Pedosphaera sp.]|nr:hypothetical protein [Pedosphaera sp.]